MVKINIQTVANPIFLYKSTPKDLLMIGNVIISTEASVCNPSARILRLLAADLM